MLGVSYQLTAGITVVRTTITPAIPPRANCLYKYLFYLPTLIKTARGCLRIEHGTKRDSDFVTEESVSENSSATNVTLHPKTAVADKQYKPGAKRLVAGKAVLNTLLTRIPDSEFAAIEPDLEFAVFHVGEYLERAGGSIRAAYFPNRGICSLLIDTSDARSVQVGLAGCEEIIGLTLIGGVDRLPYSVVVPVPGEGFRIESGTMKRIFGRMPQFTRMLVRHLSIHAVEESQNTACNRLHSLEQRLAKLLLMVHDRLDTDDISITHDFLAKMIGADRTSVSLAVGEFEERGMLTRRRGFIGIRSRHRLERESCECYQVFKAFNSELGLRT